MVHLTSLLTLLNRKIKACSDPFTRVLLSHELIKLQSYESYLSQERKQTRLKNSLLHSRKASIRTGRLRRTSAVLPHTDPVTSRLGGQEVAKSPLRLSSDTPSFNPSQSERANLDCSLDYRGSFSFRIKPDDSATLKNLHTIPANQSKQLDASGDTHQEHTQDDLSQDNMPTTIKPNPFKLQNSPDVSQAKQDSFVIHDSSLASNCSDTQDDRPRFDDTANPLQLSQAHSGNHSNLDRKHSNKVRGFNFKNKINTKKFARPLITSTSSREVELLTRHVLDSQQLVKPSHPRPHNDSLEPVEKLIKRDGFRKMSFEKSQGQEAHDSHSNGKKLNFNINVPINALSHETRLLNIDKLKKGT